jgi:aspartyl-tRNA(Asn)/glutamyl-tRNA(Gln) amidotransferase subunit C
MAGAHKLDVHYVARLARLALTPEEASTFESQLADVLRYVDKLRELDVTSIEPAAHVLPAANVLRADEAHDWFTVEEALRNAPHQANDLFIVTKVLE